MPAQYFQEYERLHVWTSHIEDVHNGNIQEHIGTQDLGPRGLRTWVARKNPLGLTLFNIPQLPANLLVIRDAAYELEKLDKDILQCFIYITFSLTIAIYLLRMAYLSQLDQIDHSVENIEAFELLARIQH